MSVFFPSLLHFITVVTFYINLASCSPDKYVKYLDPETLSEIKASPSVPVAIKVDPLGCERAPGNCQPLNEFWEAIGSVFPQKAFRLSCAEQRDICDNAGLSPVETPKGREPIFVFWVGGEFILYDENINTDEILEYIIDEVLPRSAREGGKKITVAYDAAEKYTSRTSTLVRVEQLILKGDFTNVFPILTEYIDKWPDHHSAIAFMVNVSVKLNKHNYAVKLMERELEKEPNNVFLLGRTAGILDSLDRCDEAVQLIDKALKVDRNSQDADESNRNAIVQMKEYCVAKKKMAEYKENGDSISGQMQDLMGSFGL